MRRVLLVTGGPSSSSLVGYAIGVAESLSKSASVAVFDGQRLSTSEESLLQNRETDLPESRLLETTIGAARYARFLSGHGDEYDVVHFCSQRLAFLARNPKRDVVTVHDIFPFGLERISPQLRRAYDTSVVNSVLHKWFALSMRLLRTRNVGIISDSQYILRQVSGEFGVTPDRIRVVPFPLSSQLKPSGRSFARSGLRIPESALVVLSVSTDEPRKNLAALYYLVNTSRVTFTLLRVGPFDASCVRPERRNWVVHLERVPPNVLAWCYSASDLLFFPSWAEGFGVPIVEGMRFGLPIVCSDADALSEVAEGIAVQVPPDALQDMTDAVESLLTHRSETQVRTERGRVRATLYEAGRLGYAFENAYNELLA